MHTVSGLRGIDVGFGPDPAIRHDLRNFLTFNIFQLPSWLLMEDDESTRKRTEPERSRQNRIDATLATKHSQKQAVTYIATLPENILLASAVCFGLSLVRHKYEISVPVVIGFYGIRSSSSAVGLPLLVSHACVLYASVLSPASRSSASRLTHLCLQAAACRRARRRISEASTACNQASVRSLACRTLQDP